MNYIFSIGFSTSGRNGALIGEDLIGVEFYALELQELRAYLNFVYKAVSSDTEQVEPPKRKQGRLSFKVGKALDDQYFTASIQAWGDEEVGVIPTWELGYLIQELDKAIELVNYLDESTNLPQ